VSDKASFSERDKRRAERKSGGGSGRRPGGGARWASEAYKRKVDERIFGKRGDAAKRRMEERLRAAQGEPGELRRIYREYVREHGLPDDMNVLLLLLDLDDEREVLKVLRALGENAEQASPERRNLLRRRLQNFEMSTSSDALGDAAAALLGRL
jgi:hypothetical protein